MFKLLQSLVSPPRFYSLTRFVGVPLWAIALMALGCGLWGGLWMAPADYQQGDAFRIIYVHVPSAILSLTGYTLIALFSMIYLIWRIKVMDILAQALAPIGAIFTFLALITGAIWGKPMWGTWWVWDARLTAQLILLFLYFGYLALRSAIETPTTAAKACAILALVGVVDIPIIHYSVEWWYTLHQGPTLTKLAKPAIAMSMLWPLISMLVGFFAYFMAITLMRARTLLVDQEADTSWVKALRGQNA